MGRKKKADKWVLMMRQCEADGFGVHYGHWMAAKEQKEPDNDADELPKGWKRCERCGKPFKINRTQKYCEWYCRYRNFIESGKNAEYMRKYKEKRNAENGEK